MPNFPGRFPGRSISTGKSPSEVIVLQEWDADRLGLALWADRGYCATDLTRDQARELASALSEWVESGEGA